MIKKLTALAAIISIQAALAILAGWAYLNFSSDGKILPGITCAGVPLGGMPPRVAEEALREEHGDLDSQILFLEGVGRQWGIPMRDIGAAYDYLQAAEKAYAVGRSGSVLRRVSELLGNNTDAATVALEMKFDQEALKKELEKINRDFGKAPRNARIVAKNKNLKVIASEAGLEMDLAETMKRVLSLQAGMTPRVVVASNPVTPQVRDEDVSDLTCLLGECATVFEDESRSRIANIARAAGRLDGILVKPGEIFSFNQRVSPLDEQGGYEKAPVIIDDQMIDDYGGGACQVSTTLYGAVILAGLEIIERHAHSRTVKYVSPGLDATVAEGLMDLRFRNNFRSPVYIFSSADLEEGVVRVTIIGKKEENTVYRIESEVMTIHPETVVSNNSSLAPGRSNVVSEGSPGFDVMVYRVTLKAGGKESRELLSDDYYPPEPRVVEVGPSPGKR